ncbi:hypothetical protein HGRIS_008946 [Hohenbuehelia grisea]|uniref:Uncharacterized protein n=1 Tax=Hohenbuehelia grisea TaxID=104357 RepID=A0ABR3J020_9AGAR
MEDILTLRSRMQRLADLPEYVEGPDHGTRVCASSACLANEDVLLLVIWRQTSSGNMLSSPALRDDEHVQLSVIGRMVVTPTDNLAAEVSQLPDGSAFVPKLQFKIQTPGTSHPLLSQAFDRSIVHAYGIQQSVVGSATSQHFVFANELGPGLSFSVSPWEPKHARTIHSDPGKFASLAWNRDGTALSVMRAASENVFFAGLVAYDRRYRRLAARAFQSALPDRLVEVRFTLEHRHVNVGSRFERDMFFAHAQQVTVMEDDLFGPPLCRVSMSSAK